MLGLDYSGGRPRGAAVRAAGYGFVVRYLENGLVSDRVNINAAEFADMRNNGVAVGLVWESQAQRATAGHDAGVADAQRAVRSAEAIGAAGWPIYLAIDFDIPDYAPKSSDPRAKLGPCGDYLAGAASVLGRGRTGVYGGFYAVSRALDAGLVTFAWQTVAWSGGQTDPRIHLFQRVGTITVDGVACDVDEARKSDFGQQEGAEALGGNNMAVFLKNLDVPGEYATQDGPLVNGIREGVGADTLKAWPGASCEIGLNDAEFKDRVHKSQAIEGLAAAIAGLPAQLAKAMPMNTGSLTADQLSAAVAAGVRQALGSLILQEKSTN